MSDQPTSATAAASAEHNWSPAPALTLLAVIVVWYMGVAALLLGHVL